MKMTMLCLAAIPVLALAACASVETATTAAGDSSTKYCWKDNLQDDGKNLTCNWVASKSDACDATNRSAVSRSTVATGPESVGRCNNGQWLLRVTTK